MTTARTASEARPAPAAFPKTASSAQAYAIRALAFAGLSVALATVATIAGTPRDLLPFILALGPTAIAVTMAWREGDGALRRLLRTAITRPSRRRWYALVALPVLWAFAVVGICIALGDPAAGVFAKVIPAIFIVPLVVLLPAFAEEIAWRGYALARLLPSMSPLAAALLLAGPWIVLHLYLQLPGQINDRLEIWPTVLSLAAYSVILAWVFVRTGGSVLLAALVHAAFNGVPPLMAQLDVDRAWAVRALLIAAMAIVVVLFGGVRSRAPTFPAVPPTR
jgi:membrane protease YdiL (CAAX protease family)